MDDFIAALLCLPFLILPLIVLTVIISGKIKASGLAKAMRLARHPCPRTKIGKFCSRNAMEDSLQPSTTW